MRDLTAVKNALKKHQIELPSWAFGNSGTRFKVFGQPGVPRNPYEKADDAAQVHRYTGVAPIMAVHIPWDKVDDYVALAAHARDNGIRISAVNANVFQDDDYKLGSICNPDPKVRKKALAHLRVGVAHAAEPVVVVLEDVGVDRADPDAVGLGVRGQRRVVVDLVPGDVHRHDRRDAGVLVHLGGVVGLLERVTRHARLAEYLEPGPAVAERPGRQLDLVLPQGVLDCLLVNH